MHSVLTSFLLRPSPKRRHHNRAIALAPTPESDKRCRDEGMQELLTGAGNQSPEPEPEEPVSSGGAAMLHPATTQHKPGAAIIVGKKAGRQVRVDLGRKGRVGNCGGNSENGTNGGGEKTEQHCQRWICWGGTLARLRLQWASQRSIVARRWASRCRQRRLPVPRRRLCY
jgi:hypothetical protein